MSIFGKKKKDVEKEPVKSWVPGSDPGYFKKEDGKTYVHNTGRDYQINLEEDFMQLRSFADDMSTSWTLKVEKNGVFVWSRPSQDATKSAVNILKMFAVFDETTPEVMYNVLHDADYRPVWDTSMGAGYNICRLDSNNDLGYYMLKLPTGVTNRDFCNKRSWVCAGNREFIIMNRSEPHERCPETKCVRAVSIISGYLIRQHGKGCSITYVSQSDPKGWIPTSILNHVITSNGPSVIEKLRVVARAYPEWKAKNNPDSLPWLTPEQPWSVAVENQTVEWYAKKTGASMDSIFPPSSANGVSEAPKPEEAKPEETKPEEAKAEEATEEPKEEEKKEEEPKLEEAEKEEAKPAEETERKEEEKKEEVNGETTSP
eukprot:TRINITY_DN1248_c1_g2_i1.p1 TRINITY_DN1248_c1_g2~~TRINITY_DN1248_c1_g2_i1.p1  ORF type:complete len:372 (+),score=91.22 TRINITY_DN1248_c1_g2_i1:43-1158(+)